MSISDMGHNISKMCLDSNCLGNMSTYIYVSVKMFLVGFWYLNPTVYHLTGNVRKNAYSEVVHKFINNTCLEISNSNPLHPSASSPNCLNESSTEEYALGTRIPVYLCQNKNGQVA